MRAARDLRRFGTQLRALHLKAAPRNLEAPPSLTGIIPPSLSLRGFIWCHLEAEVDPLQGKWAVSQTRQMRRDVVRSELLELEGWKLGEKGQRVRLIVGV